MNRPESTAELPLITSDHPPDPELSALPEPRRPGRRLTLASLSLTALASAAMVFALSGEGAYAFVSGPPADLGNLTHAAPGPEHSNTWVRGEALLGTAGAVRYGRPLEDDTYRLAPVAGNKNIWVQIRVPAGMEGPHFVPPTSFVGRLVPASGAGLRHQGLSSSVSEASDQQMPEGAWLLIDGEAPATTRWVLGVIVLFISFAAFSLYGLARLLKPVGDP
jgi:hypothetical protein